MAAPERERDDARRLGHKLQAARGSQAKTPRHLAYHSDKAGLAKTIFHGQQHVLAGYHVNDPVRCQPKASQPWPMGWNTLDNPDHLPASACGNSSDQRSRRGAMLDVRSRSGHLVEGALDETSPWQCDIDRMPPG